MGETHDCPIFLETSLLNITGKVFVMVLLNRLIPNIAEDNLPASQWGVRANWGTTVMVFTIVNCWWSTKKKQRTVDWFCRPHKSISHIELDKLMAHPEKTKLFLQLSTDGEPVCTWKSAIRWNTMVTCRSPFPSSASWSRVVSWHRHSSTSSSAWRLSKQLMIWIKRIECMSDTVWMAASSISDPSKHTPRRRKVKPGTFSSRTTPISSFTRRRLCSAMRLASQMPHAVLPLGQPLKYWAFSPSYLKEEHQPPHITIGDVDLKAARLITYLECIISSDAWVYKEFDNRHIEANSSFWTTTPWEQNRDSVLGGRSSYRTPLRFRIMGCLPHSHTSPRALSSESPHTILNIHWSDFVRNVEILEKAKILNNKTILVKYLLRWVGHVSRTEDRRLPKIALYC